MAGYLVVAVSVDRVLGLLAKTLGDLDQAISHFEDASEFLRPGDIRPEIAWNCYDLAGTLLLRNTSGDRQHASELLDETLIPESLLYRLFHETGVRVYPEHGVIAKCRCSSEKVERVLKSLTGEQLEDMTVDGAVSVVCEFCKNESRYDGDALATLRGTTDNSAGSSPGD